MDGRMQQGYLGKVKTMKRALTLAFLFLVGCQMLLAAGAHGATIYYVGPNETLKTIQQGITAASNYDTVIVRDGTYAGPINFNGKLVTVKSQNGPEKCIIDGGGSTQGVIFMSGENSQARLEGFTIRNCHGDTGGGIFCSSSSPTIKNCVISGNTANMEGGGIYCHSSSPGISDCIISDNSADMEGGGIFSHSSSFPIISDCTISGNWGWYGGGIMSDWSSARIINCTLSGNSAFMGAGILCNGSSLTISGCTISENSATDYGGGISFSDCYNTSPTLTNCTISGNSAIWGGGIWFQYSSNPWITNCTISGNSAADGGGIFCEQSSPRFSNSILWNDSVNEISINDAGAPIMSYCNIKGGYSGTGNINSNPLFVDAAAADFHLAGGSPCIDSADDSKAPATDKDGNSRPQDGNYDGIATSDMGAYETPALPALVTATRNPKNARYLPDDAFRNPKNRAALRKEVEVAIRMIRRENYEQALQKIRMDILPRTNGCALRGAPDRNDWIIGCEYQKLVYDVVKRAMEALRAAIAQN